jgi:GntR family transcriptional repressor for pyruvate dehydrogenase complex
MSKETETASKLAPRKKFEEIAEHLELLRLSGRLSLGDKVPSERDLMAQFGAGRASVREALFTLQRKGLLTARAGAASRVSRPSADTMVSELSGAARHMLSMPGGVRDLQHARALFEIGLARHAALHASPEDLAGLRDALDQNGAAKDQATFEKTDVMFHYTLAMIAHNPIFTSLHLALSDWLSDQRRVSALAGATFAGIYAQHRAVYEAIAHRDAAAAQVAMERHLEAVARFYWQQMSSGEGAPPARPGQGAAPRPTG